MKITITESFDWRGAKPPSKLVRLHRTKAGQYHVPDELPPEALKRARDLGIVKRQYTRKKNVQNKAVKEVNTK